MVGSQLSTISIWVEVLQLQRLLKWKDSVWAISHVAHFLNNSMNGVFLCRLQLAISLNIFTAEEDHNLGVLFLIKWKQIIQMLFPNFTLSLWKR